VAASQIHDCDGLIQLVGHAYGAEPPEVDAEYGRVSYTQLEFRYASRQGKKTWVIVIGEQFPRDKPLDQLDLPDEAARPDQAGYQAQRRDLQRSYIACLKQDNHLRYTAQNETELQNIVLRLRDELGELRRRDERRWRHLSGAIIAIVLGIAVLGGGGWLAFKILYGEVQQVAVVDTQRIRAHLMQSAEAAYRRELAEADAATPWKEREHLREAAETAHGNRVSRIEDLVTTFAEIEGSGTATGVFQEMTRILTEEGVDEAIAYVASRRTSILEGVRARTAAARARNRAELQPLLQTAALYEATGQSADARALYNDILAVDPDWEEALHAFVGFLADQGDVARVRATLDDAQRDYSQAHRLAQRLTESDPSNTQWQRDLWVFYERLGDVAVARGKLEEAAQAYGEGLEIA
jgi:tetratricopeptide (TPR) repeat protein